MVIEHKPLVKLNLNDIFQTNSYTAFNTLKPKHITCAIKDVHPKAYKALVNDENKRKLLQDINKQILSLPPINVVNTIVKSVTDSTLVTKAKEQQQLLYNLANTYLSEFQSIINDISKYATQFLYQLAQPIEIDIYVDEQSTNTNSTDNDFEIEVFYDAKDDFNVNTPQNAGGKYIENLKYITLVTKMFLSSPKVKKESKTWIKDKLYKRIKGVELYLLVISCLATYDETGVSDECNNKALCKKINNKGLKYLYNEGSYPVSMDRRENITNKVAADVCGAPLHIARYKSVALPYKLSILKQIYTENLTDSLNKEYISSREYLKTKEYTDNISTKIHVFLHVLTSMVVNGVLLPAILVLAQYELGNIYDYVSMYLSIMEPLEDERHLLNLNRNVFKTLLDSNLFDIQGSVFNGFDFMAALWTRVEALSKDHIWIVHADTTERCSEPLTTLAVIHKIMKVYNKIWKQKYVDIHALKALSF